VPIVDRFMSEFPYSNSSNACVYAVTRIQCQQLFSLYKIFCLAILLMAIESWQKGIEGKRY
jgi:hypothetical protein